MDYRVLKKGNFILTVVGLLVLYTGFVFYYKEMSWKIEKDHLAEYADTLSSSLWSYDPRGPAEYLNLICRSRNYRRITVREIHGDDFIDIEVDLPGGWQRILSSAGFIKPVHLTAVIKYRNENIGMMQVEWYPTNIFVYLYGFAMVLLLIMVNYFFQKTVSNKNELEQRVRKRTAELERKNEKLNREIFTRRQAEKALHESVERFKETTDLVPTVIVEYDRELNISYINKMGRETFGLSREDIESGYNIFQYIPTYELKEFRKRVALLLTGRRPAPAECRLLRSDGTEFFALVNTAPDIHEGSVRGVRVSFSDITELKRKEEELLSHQSRLRQLGAELVMVEERERRNIAHDLHDHIGQLLAVAKIKLKSLASVVKSEDILGSVNEAIDLLDVMIQETRSLTLQLSPPVLNELGLLPALEWLCEQFQQHHGVVVDFYSACMDLDVDEQVNVIAFRAVRELLMNAIKHSRATGIRVEVESEAERGILRFTVADNGVGFNVEEQNWAHKEEAGFGLFSIRERIVSLGGDFRIDSDPGQGAVAVIDIPNQGCSSKAGSTAALP